MLLDLFFRSCLKHRLLLLPRLPVPVPLSFPSFLSSSSSSSSSSSFFFLLLLLSSSSSSSSSFFFLFFFSLDTSLLTAGHEQKKTKAEMKMYGFSLPHNCTHAKLSLLLLQIYFAPNPRRISACSSRRTILTSSTPSAWQILLSICPRLDAAAVWTRAV